VLNGEPVEEHSDHEDQDDNGDDDNRWACSWLRLFLDDGHVWIVTRPREAKQRLRSAASPFLTDL
jgi:hypothetical protein